MLEFLHFSISILLSSTLNIHTSVYTAFLSYWQDAYIFTGNLPLTEFQQKNTYQINVKNEIFLKNTLHLRINTSNQISNEYQYVKNQFLINQPCTLQWIKQLTAITIIHEYWQSVYICHTSDPRIKMTFQSNIYTKDW